MTLDTYAHVIQTTPRTAAGRMDDASGLDSIDPDEGMGPEERPAE
ncbi:MULTISPECIES: hypothetical protein [unclassified Streptomyces]